MTASSPQRISNVEVIAGQTGDARFPLNSLDVAFMSLVYHELDQPVPLLKSLMPSLKPWGYIAMVEPAPSHTESCRPVLTRERVAQDAQQAGFYLDTMLEGRLRQDNVFILRPSVPDEPESRDPRQVRSLWEVYLAWTRSSKNDLTPAAYAASLENAGIPAREIRRRFQVLRAQFTEQPEGIEMVYDQLYGKPLTGDLEKDGFRTTPNTFLVEAAKKLGPVGKALDIGSGMGRNAIHLAGLGWEVTGIDLSAGGLAVMTANAAKSGLKVKGVRTTYESYDFGLERWDLIASILSWVPIEDREFLNRLKASVCPGGYLIFEHVIQRPDNPFPPGVHAPAPGALRELFQDFEILIYREADLVGDWGGPPTPHVRMLARKRP
jgi:SAM-dependent methyltransferase